jgi:hypothetical protein
MFQPIFEGSTYEATSYNSNVNHLVKKNENILLFNILIVVLAGSIELHR